MQALTFHGGRLDEAARRFPTARLPWIDLSTGINPFAWMPAAMPAVDWRRLPSPCALAALERAAAVAFGAPDAAVAALPGSEIGLRLLATIGLPAPFRFVAPAYRTHGEALKGAGATPIAIGTLEDEARRGGTILLANPNNPDGRIVAPERLLAVARLLGERGGWLVVDEAFADAVPGASVLPLLGKERVLVLRSFGKFFGLAGVRLGFACGAAAAVARMAAMLGSWPVSGAALTLGTAAYGDTAWIAAMRARLATAAAGLDEVLRGHGLVPVGGCPLFRLVETDRAGALFERLATAGILTRPFDDAPTWLRIGLPDHADALARLDGALNGEVRDR